MKKFATWCLNHLGLLLGIVVFTVTFAIIGGVMLNSYNAYLAYVKDFNETDLEIRSLSGAQPIAIEMNDNFKSEYKNELSVTADELNVSTQQSEYMVDDYIDLTSRGGKVSLKLSLEEKSFVDIDFEIATNYSVTNDGEEEFGIKDLISNVQFVINGEVMEESDVNLIEEDFHHLVMISFALPAGDVTVEMNSVSGKNALMPYLRGITFFSSQVLSIAEEAAE